MGYNTMAAITQGVYNQISNNAAMNYNSAEAAKKQSLAGTDEQYRISESGNRYAQSGNQSYLGVSAGRRKHSGRQSGDYQRRKHGTREQQRSKRKRSGSKPKPQQHMEQI